MPEYDVCEGFAVQLYGPRDWFPVVDADYWVREHLGCTDEYAVEVESRDGSGTRAEWGEVRAALEMLGNAGPYREGPVFADLTYNSENDLSNDLLIAAGWVDMGEQWATRGLPCDLLSAIKNQHYAEYDWDEIGRVYVVAIAYGGAYGDPTAVADVYVNPPLDDDYDVARWGVQLIADCWNETGWRRSHPVWDACGGFGDGTDDLDGTGYPWGVNEDRMDCWDLSEMSADDVAGEDYPSAGPFLAVGDAGMFAVGRSGRVYRVGAWVN